MPLHPDVVSFITRQAKAVRWHRVDPNVRTRSWLIDAMTSSNQELDTFILKVMEQLKKGANEQSFIEAQTALNEIGRNQTGTAALRRHVNRKNIQLFVKLSKRRI